LTFSKVNADGAHGIVYKQSYDGKIATSTGNLRTVKTYAVILLYRRKLVTLKVYFVDTVIN